MQVRKSILILIIIAACLCPYFNTLFADFVWDDNIFITPNPYMKSFKFLPKFFTQDFWSIGIQKVVSKYYRPLLAASFMLDYTLWHNNPFGYHLTNVIFHILASLLIFLFVAILLGNNLIAFFAALLFSVHPVHTEAVSFISGRVDVVTLVFFILSLVLFLKYTANKKIVFYLFSLFCFLVSLLIKEMAVTLPLIIVCIDYFFLSQHNAKNVFKNFLRFHLCFFVILLLYLTMRFYFVGLPFAIEENTRYVRNFPIGIGSFWRLFTVIKILIFDLRLLFFPYDLKAEYVFSAANSLLEPAVLIGIVSLLLLIIIVIKNAKRYPILSFSILWFFITILPVSNIFPQGNIFSERFMYMPSVGFCIGIGFLFSWLLNKDIKTTSLNWKNSLGILFFLLIVALGRVTYERNKVWYNNLTLWYDTAKASPQSPQAHANLAHAYLMVNLLDEALKETNIAIQLNSSYRRSFLIRGHIYLNKGLIEEAIREFKETLELFPSDAEAYHSLAIAYSRKGEYEESIEAGLNALKQNPYLNEARYNLALNYDKAGLIDEAINAYEEYLKNNPKHAGVYVDTGYLYYKEGKYEEAREHWLTALKVSKDYLPANEALKLLENKK